MGADVIGDAGAPDKSVVLAGLPRRAGTRELQVWHRRSPARSGCAPSQRTGPCRCWPVNPSNCVPGT